MSVDSSSFNDLVSRLRAGDDDAATEIFHEYARRLIGLARGRLDDLVRRKVDPEEVVQSVFRSFFRRQREGQFDLRDKDGLWALLALITLRKCGQRVDHFRAGRRNVRREVSQRSQDDSNAGWEAIAREPTPSEVISLGESLEILFQGLKERDRPILELSLQGYTPNEVSAQVGCSQSKVYRILNRVRGELELVQD